MSVTYCTCILCAECKSLKTVIDVEDQTEEILSKLSRINAKAEFHSNLPKLMCLQCIVSLNGAFDFVIMIERAQLTLAQMNKDIKQELSDDFVPKAETKEADTLSLSDIKIEDVVETVGHVSLLENALKGVAVSPFSNAASDNDSVIIEENKSVEIVKKKCKKKRQSTPLLDPPSTWKDYIWKCAICATEFPTHDELKSHSMEYHKCCNTQRCYDCNLRRGILDKFIIHVRSHRKHYKHSCYKCFKTISSSWDAGRHKRVHRQTQHYCKGCNTTFKTEKQLREHMSIYFKPLCERTSDKIVDVTCKVCTKTFKNPMSLMRHVKVHTDRPRDYTCEHCGKCFFSNNALQCHMTVHTDERPYPCDICDQRFKCRNQLLGHLRLHVSKREYSCDKCSRTFKHKKNLEVHQIIHTDLLPHVCNFCNKGFRFKSILIQHIRQHTGVKPYSCSICHREFTGWPNYNKHMKRKHNMNMSKRNMMSTTNEISESAKQYVESVCNEKKRGRKHDKPVSESSNQISDIN